MKSVESQEDKALDSMGPTREECKTYHRREETSRFEAARRECTIIS